MVQEQLSPGPFKVHATPDNSAKSTCLCAHSLAMCTGGGGWQCYLVRHHRAL